MTVEPKNFLLMGLPGSGKGTFCEQMTDYAVVGLGKVLRDEVKKQSAIGKIIQDNINKGLLIPDHLAFQLIAQTLSPILDKGNPFILEGFPSTVKQFDWFINFVTERGLLPTIRIIFLDCQPEVALERMINRRTCECCERIYNLRWKPPRVQEKCDDCRSPLFFRQEDSREVALQRINDAGARIDAILELAENQLPIQIIKSC